MSEPTLSPEEAVRLIANLSDAVDASDDSRHEFDWLGAVYARPGWKVSVSMEGHFTAPTLRAIADILDRVPAVPAR